MATRHANVYLDISAYQDRFPWDEFTRFNAEHKVLFATDNLLSRFEATLDTLDGVGISAEFKTKVKGENATRLL